jgi:molecular chaperone DnaJ
VEIELTLVESFHGVTKTFPLHRAEVCKECSGRGSRRGTQPSVCRRCNGQGVVLLNQGFFRLQQTCPGCGGHGQVITDPCPQCHGEGQVQVEHPIEVKVPAGVDTGDTLRVPGEGQPGEPGAPAGDLYCHLRVRSHPLFQRDGANLICQVPITFSQAALGGGIEVPALDGRIEQTLKRGTQSGDVVRIAGRGMPSVRGGRRGDLLVQLVVETPRQLTKRQEELLRELAELDHKHVSPERKSFLDKVKDFFTATPAEQ